MSTNKKNVIQQSTVNQLYKRLYDQIRTAHSDAKKQNKNLSILLAEEHCDLNSYFLEMMVFDICERLGIKNLGLECDAGQISENASVLDGELNRNFLNATPFIKKLRLASVLDGFQTTGDAHKEGGEPIAVRYTTSKAFGLACSPIDPAYTERRKERDQLPPEDPALFSKQYEILTSDKVESAMTEALAGMTKKGDSVACLGALHVPYIEKALKDQHSPVLVINCMAGLSFDGIIEDLRKNKDSHTAIFDEVTRRVKSLSQSFTPALSQEPQVGLCEGLHMILVASALHQGQKGKIGAKEVQMRITNIREQQAQRVGGKA